MKRLLRLILLRLLALFAWPWLRKPPATVERVLYLKPDHLGDLLLATPALAALRQGFPDAQITAMVGPWSTMMLARNPSIDVLLDCPFPGFERRRRELPVGRLGQLVWPYLLLVRYAALIRAGHYDLAIIGRDDHWWGAALVMLAGIPRRIGFAVAECQPFLSEALPYHADDHVTRQGLALARQALGILPAAEHSYPTRFIPSPEDRAWATAWLAEQLEPGQRLVIIHPGTGGPAKHWLDERWSAVADALAARPDIQLALTGGPGEEARVARVRSAMSEHAIDVAGKTTVGQLAALMEQATLVLGVDSGPLHLAAATGVATIHLYGPGDEHRFGPWGQPERHVVLESSLWCRPCGVLTACPRGLAQPECMTLIDSAPVAQAALALLDQH